MDAVDASTTDEAYNVLDIICQQQEHDTDDQEDKKAVDTPDVDVQKKKDMIQACG